MRLKIDGRHTIDTFETNCKNHFATKNNINGNFCVNILLTVINGLFLFESIFKGYMQTENNRSHIQDMEHDLWAALNNLIMVGQISGAHFPAKYNQPCCFLGYKTMACNG